jgi:hypothetical protein
MKNPLDQYLADDLLTPTQHRAGKYLYEKNTEDELVYRQSIRLIRRRYGELTAYVVQEVVVHGWDVSGKEGYFDMLKEGLQWIADQRMKVSGGGQDVSHHEIPVGSEI